MNPTRMNNAAATTTTTTTGSKLIKSEFRYLPLMATANDAVVPMTSTGSDTTAFSGVGTTAIATPSGSLVHVIPVQFATATNAPGNFTTLNTIANPTTSPLAIFSQSNEPTGIQVQTKIIPLDTTQFVQQTQQHQHQAVTIAMPLSIPTNNDIHTMFVRGNAGVSSLVGNVGIQPTSCIFTQESPKSGCNVSTISVPSLSSSQTPAPTTVVVPTSTNPMASTFCQITNVLPSQNLSHEMVKKIVIGNTTNSNANINTSSASFVMTQMQNQQQLQPQMLQQQNLKQLNTFILKNQNMNPSTTTKTPKVTTNTAVATPPQLPLVEQASILAAPQQKLAAASQRTSSSTAQQQNEALPSIKFHAPKTEVVEQTTNSAPIHNNNQLVFEKIQTSAPPTPLYSNPLPLKANPALAPANMIAKVQSDHENVSKNKTEYDNTVLVPAPNLPEAKTSKNEGKRITTTREQRQESLLKTKPVQRITTECTSPRAKRSKSLNNSTTEDFTAQPQTTTIATATERRFSSPEAQNKIDSNTANKSPQDKSDTTFILIDDDNETDINQELAGFDEEYLDKSDNKSTDPSEYDIEIITSNLKQKLNEKTQSAELEIKESADKNVDSIVKNPAVSEECIQNENRKIEKNKQKVIAEATKISIINEPQVKCKEVLNDDTNEHILNEPLDKSLFCDEQLLVTSSSTSASSISSNSLKNSSAVESAKIASKSSPVKSSGKASSSKSSTVSSSASSSLPANSTQTTLDTKFIDINSYSTVLGMLSTFNMLSWKERIGIARGTNLRFQLNEFNLLQVHERCPPRYRIHTAYEKPIYERDSYSMENSDPLLYLCRRCNCYGPAGEFLAPEFCSLECLKRDSRKRQRDVALHPRKRPRKDIIANAPASTAVPISAAKTSDSQNTVPSTYSNNSSSLLRRSIFRWSTYITGKFGEGAAPVHLFLNPFPTGPNNFQIGMKLEAIDPENCSLFCVCTVVDIQGYRLNLTFDGYDRMYNFWVNADSMDIFPPGWCAKTNRILQPPKGLDAAKFNWPSYLVKEHAVPAPRQIFTHLNSSSLPTRNPFKIGMHLEAEDLNDTGKLCVATVADILDERIRIHFDGWDDCYDYWVDTDSPYIHPCGWYEGRHQLVVPPDFENSAFSWSEYIKGHPSKLIAPPEIFAAREPIDFKPKMKLEVVDPRNPMLIRPATVMARKGHRVKIHLDQWPMDYCFWLEDDSPDLHPIGWCDATRHDLEPPPGYQSRPIILPCSIAGCRGIGNAKQYTLNMHSAKDACPYSPENWSIKIERPPRLENNDIERKTTAKANVEQIAFNKREAMKAKQKQQQQQAPVAVANSNKSTVADDIMERLRLLEHSVQEKFKTRHSESMPLEGTKFEKLLDIKQEPKSTLEVGDEKQNIEDNEKPKTITATALPAILDAPTLKIAKEYLCDYGPRLHQNYNIWQTNLNYNCNDIKKNPLQWTTTECCLFVEKLLNLKAARAFANEDIDGAALLALHQSDLTDVLDLKLGPAIKLYAHILQLRTFCVKISKAALKN